MDPTATLNKILSDMAYYLESRDMAKQDNHRANVIEGLDSLTQWLKEGGGMPDPYFHHVEGIHKA